MRRFVLEIQTGLLQLALDVDDVRHFKVEDGAHFCFRDFRNFINHDPNTGTVVERKVAEPIKFLKAEDV